MAGREITDADRLDAGLKAAQQAVGEAGGLSEPLILAEDVDLAKYEDWAVGKTVSPACGPVLACSSHLQLCRSAGRANAVRLCRELAALSLCRTSQARSWARP